MNPPIEGFYHPVTLEAVEFNHTSWEEYKREMLATITIKDAMESSILMQVLEGIDKHIQEEV